MLLDQHLATTGETPSRDLESRFERLGDGVQHSITTLRDEILGRQRADEDLNGYRIRSQQAYRQAEETVLARLLEVATPHNDRDEDVESTGSTSDLALISDQLSRLDRGWTDTAP